MLKFTDNPPVLAPTLEAIGAAGGSPWWVGHTKARNEKALAWDFVAAKVDYFLPLVERVKISGGKRRRLMMPLFPGYIFFRGDEETRYRAMTTDRLCTVIPVREEEQPRLVRELTSLQKAIAGKAELELYPFAVVGRRCRVVMGAYMGTEGTIVDRNDKRARVVMVVSILKQGALLEVDLDAIEAVEEESDAGRGLAVQLKR